MQPWPRRVLRELRDQLERAERALKDTAPPKSITCMARSGRSQSAYFAVLSSSCRRRCASGDVAADADRVFWWCARPPPSSSQSQARSQCPLASTRPAHTAPAHTAPRGPPLHLHRPLELLPLCSRGRAVSSASIVMSLCAPNEREGHRVTQVDRTYGSMRTSSVRGPCRPPIGAGALHRRRG